MAKKRGPGRPRLSGEKKKRNHIAVYVTDEELALIDAARGPVPRSTWALELIQRVLRGP